MTNDDITPNEVVKDPPRGPCYEYQNDHIDAEELYEQIDVTPNEDLRELIKEWNTREYHLGEAQDERRKELEKCRRELEEAIEESVQR